MICPSRLDLKFGHIPVKIGLIWGGRGGLRNFFSLIGILIFLLLRSPSKISKPQDMALLDFNNGPNKKGKKEKYAKQWSTLSCSAGARTSLGPTFGGGLWYGNGHSILQKKYIVCLCCGHVLPFILGDSRGYANCHFAFTISSLTQLQNLKTLVPIP